MPFLSGLGTMWRRTLTQRAKVIARMNRVMTYFTTVFLFMAGPFHTLGTFLSDHF